MIRPTLLAGFFLALVMSPVTWGAEATPPPADVAVAPEAAPSAAPAAEAATTTPAAPAAEASTSTAEAAAPTAAADAAGTAPANASAPAATPGESAETQVADDPVVCKRVEETGTRLRRSKTCMKKSEWDKIKNSAQDMMKQNERRKSIGVGGDNPNPTGG